MRMRAAADKENFGTLFEVIWVVNLEAAGTIVLRWFENSSRQNTIGITVP